MQTRIRFLAFVLFLAPAGCATTRAPNSAVAPPPLTAPAIGDQGCRFENPLQFEPGQVDLTPTMADALAKLVPLVLDRPCTLVVEGHAQAREAGPDSSQSLHEIALRRALAVLQELQRLGFPRHRLVLAAVEESAVTSLERPSAAPRSPLLDDRTADEIDRSQRAVEIWVYDRQ